LHDTINYCAKVLYINISSFSYRGHDDDDFVAYCIDDVIAFAALLLSVSKSLSHPNFGLGMRDGTVQFFSMRTGEQILSFQVRP